MEQCHQVEGSTSSAQIDEPLFSGRSTGLFVCLMQAMAFYTKNDSSVCFICKKLNQDIFLIMLCDITFIFIRDLKAQLLKR